MRLVAIGSLCAPSGRLVELMEIKREKGMEGVKGGREKGMGKRKREIGGDTDFWCVSASFIFEVYTAKRKSSPNCLFH